MSRFASPPALVSLLGPLDKWRILIFLLTNYSDWSIRTGNSHLFKKEREIGGTVNYEISAKFLCVTYNTVVQTLQQLESLLDFELHN
jgi:hypothetical protein